MFVRSAIRVLRLARQAVAPLPLASS
jgi:hypothetical protein